MAEKRARNAEARDAESRSPYRDNDDMRDPLAGNERTGVKPDSRAEARGSARESVGNNTRGTDASPTGPEDNDKTRRKPTRDRFDEDLTDD